MSEWNLSVRLTGQGSGLARTLRTLAGDARDASRDVNALKRDIQLLRREARRNIRISLDVDAGHLRSDVSAALTSARAGQNLRVRLDVDAAHLRADVSSALTAAGSGQGLTVNLRLGNAMQLRREVEDAVRWAAWGHRIEIPIGLADPMQLRRDVSDAVRWASMSQTITVRVTPDTSALRTLGGTLPGGGSSGGGGGADFGLAGLLPIATAAIPLIAGLTASIAPLTGMLVATGGAATVFGIALAGQIGPLNDAADAEKKYQDAVREHGGASMEAAQAQLAYQKQLASMPPATQKAAVALSRLKTSFGDWSDEMSTFTMEPVTKGFTVLESLLPHLSPEVESFSGSMDRLMNVAGGAINTPGFNALSDRIAELTDAKVDDFTDQIIHLLRVVSQGDADAGAVGQIMAYFRENGPEARAAVDAIGDAVVTLAQGAAAAGPTMLTLVTAAARLVAALPPELVAIILQTAAALKLLQLSGAGFAVLAAGVGRVRTAILGLAAASTAAGGGLAGLRAAFLALSTAGKASVVVAGIAAAALAIRGLSDIGEEAPPNVDKLTTSLGQLGRTGKLTGEATKTFGKNFSELNDVLGRVTDPSVVESINNWGADITNGFLDGGDAAEELAKKADATDKALVNLVRNGNADLARQALANITAGMDPERAARFREELEGYPSALADLAFEQDTTADSMGLFGHAALDTSLQLDAAKRSADGLKASLIALNEVNQSAEGAQIAFEKSLDDLTASFKEHGNTLNLDTADGLANREAMLSVAQAHDELLVSGIAAGQSFASLSVQSKDLRAQMLELATKGFGGNTQAATEYVNKLLGIPSQVDTFIKAETEQAMRGLGDVQAAIDETPNAHRVVVSTLNAAAIAALEAVGIKTEALPDGKTAVYTANGSALGNIAAVSAALSRLDGSTATTTVMTVYKSVQAAGGSNQAAKNMAETEGRSADGNIYGPARVQRFAAGGLRENHVAQIAQPTFRMWAEPETGGEAYIPFATSKRPRSRAIAEETVRRLGGDPESISWHANGSVTDWRYDPVSGGLFSASTAGAAGKKTKKVKGKEVEYFDLGAVEKKLKSISKLTLGWNNDLATVADRVGGDVADALASMGEEGMTLARKMAHGSTKYINEMAAALRNLQKTAKASLTDYTRQLTSANKVNKDFSDDLVRLAGMGYGDLAAQLAQQGDTAAQQLADAATRDRGKAAKANAAAKAAGQALTSDEVQDLVQIIAAVRTKTTGLHDVAAASGLGEDQIITVANKARGQISGSLGSRAERFLSDLAKANRGLAYADGGIRAGLYATQGGIVRFAEPSTHGEAYIPLGANKRRTALPVLTDVASRFGVGLTDGQANRVVIIREAAPLVGESHFHIGDRKSDRDLARAIEYRQSYQLRRLARGGVGARG